MNSTGHEILIDDLKWYVKTIYKIWWWLNEVKELNQVVVIKSVRVVGS